MYTEFVLNFTGMPLVVAAIAAHFIGSHARKKSAQAARYAPVAACALVALVAYIGMDELALSFSDFFRVELIRILLVAVIAYGISSFAIKIFFPAYESLIVAPAEAAEAKRKAQSKRREDALAKKEQQRIEAEQRKNWEAGQPERERQLQLQQQRERQKAISATEEAERREQARAKTLLMYHRHSADMAESFTWERFCEFTDRFMNDSLPAAKVEANAEKLEAMMLSFFEEEQPAAKPRTRLDIHEEFNRARDEIRQMNYSKDEEDSALARIAFEERQALMEET